MKIGIVGLPNVGKSTLFTALTKKRVPRENYPFCTIEPNVGVVSVPDKRLQELTRVSASKLTTETTIEFVDIAGLVKDAHKGEGLGNKFLSHIKEVDAICHVVRAFEDSSIHHVEKGVDPNRDIEIINLELIMNDLDAVVKRMETLRGKAKTGDVSSQEKLRTLENIHHVLDQGRGTQTALLTDGEKESVRELNLLSAKPTMYVANTSGQGNEDMALPKGIEDTAHVLSLNIQLEAELAELSEQETQEYVQEFGLDDIGLNKFIRASYELLDLVTFFTSGEKESRAWTLKRGACAKEAAGKIHTDIERGFIRAEVVSYDAFITASGWTKAKEIGLIRIEGKDYVVKDGDVCYFRFNL